MTYICITLINSISRYSFYCKDILIANKLIKIECKTFDIQHISATV